MAYATLEDIKKRIPEETLIQLTDDQDISVVDEAVVEDIIGGAGELIDGFLRGVYQLPMNPVPGMIKAIALDLCIYDIYARRPEFGIPEPVDKKRTAQMQVLGQIQTGKIRLGIAGAATPTAETPADGVLVSSGTAIFTKDVLDRY